MSKNSGKFTIGALFAAAVGYLAGILTAPKSGKDTREDIHKTAVKAKKDAEKTLKGLHKDLDDMLDQATKHAKTAKKTSQDELTKLVEKAKGAKQKAKETITNIHEGEVEKDEDLGAAIEEVTDAIEHLRSYLGKKTK